MKNSRRTKFYIEYILFGLYILAFLLFAVTLMLRQPLANITPEFLIAPPDEEARYLVPQYICEHGTLPTGLEEEVRIPNYGISYAVYNYFPYIVMGCVMRVAQLFTDSKLILLYSARAVNVFSGLLTASVVYNIGLRIFKDDKARWLFNLTVTFLPQALFIHTYVNCDSFCALSISLIMYSLIASYQDGFKVKTDILMALGVSLCVLSYYNGYAFVLAAVFLSGIYFIDGKSFDKKGFVKHAVIITALVLIASLWCFIRSAILFDGDIFGFRTTKELLDKYATDYALIGHNVNYAVNGKSVFDIILEKRFWEGLFNTFVGCYGSIFIKGNVWMYRFYLLFGACGVLLFIASFFDRKNKLTKNRIVFVTGMVLACFITVSLTVIYSYGWEYQNQGRYVMPILIALSLAINLGIEWFSQLSDKKMYRYLMVTMYAICMAACILSVYTMVFRATLPLLPPIGENVLNGVYNG